MSICYIIGAGDLEGAEYLRPQSDDLIIAADGGLVHLNKLGIKPHILIGDFDSLPQDKGRDENQEWEEYHLPIEKDDTDMAAGAKIAINRGFHNINIFGGTGGRMDHTLANIQLLAWLTEQGCRVKLYGKGYVLLGLRNGTYTLPKECRGGISVFAFSDVALGVTERGLKYSLDNYDLKNTEPLGVSNQFTGQEASISVREGLLLIYMERDYGL